jgi:hypothetical protein
VLVYYKADIITNATAFGFHPIKARTDAVQVISRSIDAKNNV